MMAEEKFLEVQKLIEIQLALQTDVRSELLFIYYQALKNQNKHLPINFLLELAETESQKQNHELVLKLISEVSNADKDKFYLRIIKLQILAAEDQGRMDDLHQHLSECLVRQYEKQVPYLPDWIRKSIDKYFRNDYSLRLKELALTLVLGDIDQAEFLTRDLIIQCFERSSPKGTSAKLLLIGEIIKTSFAKNHLTIYENLCSFTAQGIQNKIDLKRVAEMVIYFDDFPFQILVLNLLEKLKLNTVAEDYAGSIKNNPQYNFVYLDKYFSNLKKFFFHVPDKGEQFTEAVIKPDLVLKGKIREEVISPIIETDEVENETNYFNIIKYQNFSPDQLCDLTISFIQSEMPRVALFAIEEALKKSKDNESFLKASYLKLNCLLQLKDFRAALDTCLHALTKASSEADILSFLYGQAEIHLRLNEMKQAKSILKKILKIDASYRLTKERLDKLDEI